MKYQLAQINIGRTKGLPDSDVMQGFMAALDDINALADRTPGFVWRLQSDAGNAMDIRAFDDPLLAINMSVWRDLESLFGYVYQSAHTDFLKRRKEWFEPFDSAHACMWWVPAGRRPTMAEGKERLDHFNKHGASVFSFSFKESYSSPS